MMRFRRPLSVLLTLSASVSLLACSSNDDSKKPTGDDTTDTTEEKYLGSLTMPKAGEGFQVRSQGEDIPAGQDLEFCEVGELPGELEDEYWVSSLEFANGKGSHHLIVDVAKDDGPAKDVLAKLNVGDRVPCLSSQSQFGDGFEFIGGAQTPYRDFVYPEGVGRKFHGKQRFVFDYHYLNTGDDTVHALSAVNFHLTKKEKVTHIAQIFSFANMTIDTPPGAERSFTGECKMKDDIKLIGLTRHTHRWGREYAVWFAGGGNDGDQIWSSPDYESDVDHAFDGAIDVKAGEGFRFQCDYQNTETHALRFGPNATDEMCILFGLWYSETSNEPPAQDCVMTQVDDDGVARVTTAGSIPAPTADQITECKAQVPASGTSDECASCTCDTCAALIDTCRGDADCNPILACINASGCFSKGQSQCISDCQDVINEHSPGTGALIQVAQCIQSSCSACVSKG